MNICSNINQLFSGHACLLCGEASCTDHFLCAPCHKDLPGLSSASCPQCALPSLNGHACGHCLRSPPAFDRTYAPFSYEYPVDAMLQRYKYQHKLNMTAYFADAIASTVTPGQQPDLLIPMPLHPLRLRERGYNQSLEIARHLGKCFSIPLDFSSCQRTTLTPPQASLPLKARVKNMKRAFDCKRRFDGLRIALIDDVMTTGASLNELAKTLKAAGAAHVECWVVARTLPR